MNAADRRWLLKQLRKLREDMRVDQERVLQEVLGEEARMIFLENMTRHLKQERQ